MQVSTDGGVTYESSGCTSSRADASPHARPVIGENLPGHTAYSGGWRSESCDLSAFAGKSIHLAFRNVTDGSVSGDPDDPAASIPAGFWLRSLELGGASVGRLISRRLAVTISGAADFRPGVTLQLVALDKRRPAVSIPLDSGHDASLAGWLLRHLFHRDDLVGALVMDDEPTETVAGSAPYALHVNGVLQPGG